MKKSWLALPLAAATFAFAPAHAADGPQLVPVWSGAIPGAVGETRNVGQEMMAPWNERIVRNVTKPMLEVHLADAKLANGSAVIVVPGGGFRFVSVDNEGTQVTDALNAKGITAFILRYRMMPTPPTDAEFTAQLGELLGPLFGPGIYDEMKKWGPAAIADAGQAMKLVRSRAKQWKIAPDRIGMLGFSAGGVATLGALLDHDKNSRPDFAALIYPGPWAVDKVPADAPPLFVAAAKDDALTPLAAEPQAKAFADAGHPVETHFYEKGGHGFGMKQQGVDADLWMNAFTAWLDAQGFLKKGK